jgi:hypothetical protein
MAKAKSGKKREKAAGDQPQLPGTRAASPTRESSPASATRVLPMQLQIGDRISDETGEWEVVGRPHTTAGGKTAHVRVRRADQPAVIEERSWGAHERVAVKRA